MESAFRTDKSPVTISPGTLFITHKRSRAHQLKRVYIHTLTGWNWLSTCWAAALRLPGSKTRSSGHLTEGISIRTLRHARSPHSLTIRTTQSIRTIHRTSTSPLINQTTNSLSSRKNSLTRRQNIGLDWSWHNVWPPWIKLSNNRLQTILVSTAITP